LGLGEATAVPQARFAKLQEAHDALQKEVLRLTDQIREQEQINKKLAACKDKAEAAAVIAAHTDTDEQAEFERLSYEFKKILGEFSSVFHEAVFHYARDEEWHPRDSFNEEEWADIRRAEQRQYLNVNGTCVTPNIENRKIARVLQKLDELNVFFGNASEDFSNQFGEEFDISVSFTNRDVWDRFDGL
jgi:hypothetical protein